VTGVGVEGSVAVNWIVGVGHTVATGVTVRGDVKAAVAVNWVVDAGNAIG
jgi:hypothetical protein